MKQGTLCPECEQEHVYLDDYICRTCRLAFEGQTKGETVIYHGSFYKGNILDCKVLKSWDDGQDPLSANYSGIPGQDRGVLLVCPEAFSHKTSFWTKEQLFRCQDCKRLAVVHWEPDDGLCAICAGAKTFGWAYDCSRVPPLDKTQKRC